MKYEVGDIIKNTFNGDHFIIEKIFYGDEHDKQINFKFYNIRCIETDCQVRYSDFYIQKHCFLIQGGRR